MPEFRFTLWTCGRCGRPRGMQHACSGRRAGRDSLKPRLTIARACPHCGKPALNPLTHTCAKPSDFRKRKTAQKRAERNEERKRKRRATAARKRARAKERKRKAAERRKQAAKDIEARRRQQRREGTHDKTRHDVETCTDPFCNAYGCRVFRSGVERGRLEGHAEGFSKGYAAGLNAGPGGRW